MAARKKVLCIDFDDVIINSKPLIEEYLEIIEFKASEKYLKSIMQSYHDGILDYETYRQLRREHFDYKDRVLEEVDNKYKGLIDYRRIININNAFPNAIAYVNYLCDCGYYDEIYIISHHNVPREVEIKRDFINKYFNLKKVKVEYVPVPFHEEVYEVGKDRMMTNKALYFMNLKGIDCLSNYKLIDNSVSNGKQWRIQQGLYARYVDREIKRHDELSSLNPFMVMSVENMPRLYPGQEEREEMELKKSRK